MGESEFRELVRAMREAQIFYARARDPSILEEVERHEARVDQALRPINPLDTFAHTFVPGGASDDGGRE